MRGLGKALRFAFGLDLLVALTLAAWDRPVLLLWLPLALVLHEAGHARMARALGLSPSLRISLRGVRVAVRPRNPREGLLIALGGPCASLATGAIFLAAHLLVLGVVSVCAGLVSLVPIKPMDGYVAWQFATHRSNMPKSVA